MFLKNLHFNYMIKTSTYIRKFTDKQRAQMQRIAVDYKMKTAPEILFFALDQFADQQNEIARLKRLIEYKQNKIERLSQPHL